LVHPTNPIFFTFLNVNNALNFIDAFTKSICVDGSTFANEVLDKGAFQMTESRVFNIHTSPLNANDRNELGCRDFFSLAASKS